jgi:cell fate regulator YaaT (PSP1 superfamily)
MGCIGCSTSVNGGSPKGCRNNGHCSTGGCNKLNTFDWLNVLDIEDAQDPVNLVEVSFKNGNRKSFYTNNPQYTRAQTGDMVVVEADTGYDVGRVSLSGELVKLQMQKKRFPEDPELKRVSRIAGTRDLQKLEEARKIEKKTLIRARELVRMLGLDMKIGDVEYQGDKRKATFYYIADGRVDFRELIRYYAQEFKIKVEMRQIGARQESGLIGGMGSCGRELCCSTWLTNFKSVTTTAARYQNLAINQTKLSGQCGRLKCCLNFELDTYMDALQDFPENADKLEADSGIAYLIKKDIFKKLMYYSLMQEGGRRKILPLTVERVKEIWDLNKKGDRPNSFEAKKYAYNVGGDFDEGDIDFEDINNVIDLPPEPKRKPSRKRKGKSGRKPSGSRKKGGRESDNKGPENRKRGSRNPRSSQGKSTKNRRGSSPKKNDSKRKD